jgi:hypothetical protein
MFYAMLPWLSDDLLRTEAIMGPNMWPYRPLRPSSIVLT